MDNSGGRRVLVPMQMPGANQSGGSRGEPGAYAVLQLVGFAHSPNGNTNATPTIIWSPTAGAAASPLPSPRNATTAGAAAAMESPRAQPSEAEKAQQQQQVATTFVQADTSSFKEVVQKLTGASDEKKLPITMPARYLPRSAPTSAPAAAAVQADHQQNLAPKPAFEVGPRKAAFKPQLHERRQNLRRLGINVNPSPPSPLRVNLNGRMINPPEILSPSMLDFPSLVLSPVTPLGGDPFIDCPSSTTSTTSTSASSCSLTEEDKAIAEKGFYLHPSPLHTPRGSEPELLPLFPLHSPRDSDASS
ncbi:hypothetical protein SUGI_0620480 [Cryptomeria japonica]|uniref:VQ motif-containing protein 4 n=1 Tax=Cryptomeria japonica TaxID=3369 RepID=UPI00241495A1|nr:VQ motif-containing protein 4 [Cryptomeria japonica]GLJ31023.1 hypothetical protein SUGI_0620480 [Cryptomeria japonica]